MSSSTHKTHKSSRITVLFDFDKHIHTCIYILKYIFPPTEGRDSSSSMSNDRTPNNEFGPCTDGKCIKRTSQDITSGMWFGPRLGRRRRADRKLEMNSDIETLANALDGSRWTVITIPGIYLFSFDCGFLKRKISKASIKQSINVLLLLTMC